MNINIKATNTTLTDSIRSNVQAKLEPLEKFLRPEDVIHLELAEDTKHQSGQFFRVDIQISPRGYYAEARANDFYEAMDLLVPKIKHQFTKEKEKGLSFRKRLGKWFRKGE